MCLFDKTEREKAFEAQEGKLKNSLDWKNVFC